MKILAYMATSDGSTTNQVEFKTEKELKKTFDEFMKNHSTKFNDYSEFHCRYVD